MPSSSSKRPVFHSVDRPGSRPRSVFDDEGLVGQSYRSVAFPDISPREGENDFAALRAAAQEARQSFESELEVAVAQAERRGHELGLQEALESHREEQTKLTARLQGAIQAFHVSLERTEENATKDALRLGLVVAERLTRYALTSKPEALSATLVAAVGKMEGEDEVKVVASPEVAEQLSSHTADIMGELRVSGFTVEADDSMQPGDLMIYRGNVALDARVATRIRKLEQSLLEELGFDGAFGEAP